MKQANLKKMLVSGAATLGVIGLSSPAAFAMSNSYGGNYSSHNSYRKSYSSWSNSYNKDYNRKPVIKIIIVTSQQKYHNNCDHEYGDNNSYGNSYESSNRYD